MFLRHVGKRQVTAGGQRNKKVVFSDTVQNSMDIAHMRHDQLLATVCRSAATAVRWGLLRGGRLRPVKHRALGSPATPSLWSAAQGDPALTTPYQVSDVEML